MNPAASADPAVVAEFNRMCTLMEPYAQEEAGPAGRSPGKSPGDAPVIARDRDKKPIPRPMSASPARPQSALPGKGSRRGEGASVVARLPAKSALRMAVEQMSRFMLSNKVRAARTLGASLTVFRDFSQVLIRRTLATGSFSSLHAEGSVAQFVYHDAELGSPARPPRSRSRPTPHPRPIPRWVSGAHQSPESAVVGALIGLGGQATGKASFALKVGDLAKRTRALMKSSER